MPATVSTASAPYPSPVCSGTPSSVMQQAYTREHGLRVPIEVETRDLGEVREVLALLDGGAGVRVDRIMLDNMARRDPSAPGAPRRRELACWP